MYNFNTVAEAIKFFNHANGIDAVSFRVSEKRFTVDFVKRILLVIG
jgi:hypothetical protein